MTQASMASATTHAEYRAAGTDISERRRSGISKGPLIDIRLRPTRRGCNGRGRRASHRRLHHHRRDCRRRAHRRSYPGIAAAALGLPRRRSAISRRSAATSPSARAAGTFAIRTIACLKKAGRIARALGQSSLSCRLRSRPLRGAASLDHGGGAFGLRRQRRHRPADADDR